MRVQKELEEKEEEKQKEKEQQEADDEDDAREDNADEESGENGAADETDEQPETEDGAAADGGEEESKDEEERPEPLEIEADGLDTRTVRLTTHASALGDFAMAPDGKALYYLASFEGGFDLWKQDFQERSTTLLAKLGAGGASMQLSDDGATLYLLSNGSLSKIETASGQQTLISFAAEMVVDRAAERAHNFDHVWRQTRKKFYRPDMHGVDWAWGKVLMLATASV